MMKKKRKKGFASRPTDISVLLGNCLQGKVLGSKIGFFELSKHFEEIVGERLVPYVSFEDLDGSTLVLKASNAVWKSELFLQKKAIIVKCNQFMNAPIVKDIRFT